MDTLQGTYEAQGSYHEAEKKEKADAPQVGAYHVFRGQDDVPPFSFTIWQAGVDALLPRAEQVLFAVHDEAKGEPVVRAQVSWGKALELVGDLMEEQEDLYPGRWRVRSFPDTVRLAALRAASRE